MNSAKTLNPASLSIRLLALLAALAAAVALMASLGSARADAAPARCGGTFQVLHNDRIGKLQLPAGKYTITVRSPQKLSCDGASRLFTRFLEDYDGILPSPWILHPSSATFIHGKGSNNSFSVARAGGGGGGGNNSGGGGKHPRNGGSFCPGTFRVLHNDHIGALQLKSGPYWIILTQANGITCAQASHQFTRFLASVSGVLPSPWVMNVQLAKFKRGPHGPGFRVKPVNS